MDNQNRGLRLTLRNRCRTCSQIHNHSFLHSKTFSLEKDRRNSRERLNQIDRLQKVYHRMNFRLMKLPIYKLNERILAINVSPIRLRSYLLNLISVQNQYLFTALPFGGLILVRRFNNWRDNNCGACVCSGTSQSVPEFRVLQSYHRPVLHRLLCRSKSMVVI